MTDDARARAERLAQQLYRELNLPSGDDAYISGEVFKALREYGDAVRRETIERCAQEADDNASDWEKDADFRLECGDIDVIVTSQARGQILRQYARGLRAGAKRALADGGGRGDK